MIEAQMSVEQINMVLADGYKALQNGQNFVNPLISKLNILYHTPTVGASGAVFGFVSLWHAFPNTLIYLYFAIPIKAKYFVAAYGALELWLGLQNNPGDNVAHFAHLAECYLDTCLSNIGERIVNIFINHDNKRLKNSFNQGSLLSRLIYINLGFFVIIKILGVFFFLFNLSSYEIIDLLALPAESKKLLSKPWTIITYMFVHNGFIHLIFNLLWLYFGGTIFLKYLSNKQIVSTYILGGLTGGYFIFLLLIIFPFLSQYLHNL